MAIETPKASSFGFHPAVFRLLTLVHMKRVMGVPLAKEIRELETQLQRVNNH
jgi:hypothetical protein